MKFKSEHTFEQRKAESERVRAKYPDRIPGEQLSILYLFFYLSYLDGSEDTLIHRCIDPFFIISAVICEKIEKSKIEVS